MQIRNKIQWDAFGRYLFVGFKNPLKDEILELKAKYKLAITFCDFGLECFSILEKEKINYLVINEMVEDTSFLEILMLVRSKFSKYDFPIFLALESFDPEIEYDAYNAGVDELVIQPYNAIDFFKLGMDHLYSKSLDLKEWADAVNLNVKVVAISDNDFFKRNLDKKLKKINIKNLHFLNEDDEGFGQVKEFELIFIDFLNVNSTKFKKILDLYNSKGVINNNIFLVINEKDEDNLKKLDIKSVVKNYVFYPFEVLQLIHAVKVIHFLA